MPVVVQNPNNSGTISMALAGVTPLVDYACQVTDFMVDSTMSTVERSGTYCADAADEPDTVKFQVTISFLQDWGASPSLSQFTLDNRKKLCDFSFVPDIEGFPTVTGQLYVSPSPIGGPAGSPYTAGPLNWPMEGAPITTPAVALAATAAAKK